MIMWSSKPFVFILYNNLWECVHHLAHFCSKLLVKLVCHNVNFTSNKSKIDLCKIYIPLSITTNACYNKKKQNGIIILPFFVLFNTFCFRYNMYCYLNMMLFIGALWSCVAIYQNNLVRLQQNPQPSRCKNQCHIGWGEMINRAVVEIDFTKCWGGLTDWPKMEP